MENAFQVSPRGAVFSDVAVSCLKDEIATPPKIGGSHAYLRSVQAMTGCKKPYANLRNL